MTKVSIIVPVYNTEKYLCRCLDSLVKQTLKDIEIICIDDASTDNSKNIIKEYEKKYANIKGYYLTINKGAANARNIGLNKSQGEFIGFCDSDDFVDEGYFENLYNQSKTYDLVRGIRLIDKRHCKNEYGCLVPSIIRRTFLIQNNLRFPNKKVGEDSTLKRWIYNHTNKILEVEDNGQYYHYMKRAGSLSNYDIEEKNE